ncbi:MAG: hypothetical protein KKA05_03225 [Alphaproteobacteria bacterium]|nr:hypothetical protein [Alphaproteobacteria bacterium]
MTRYIYTLLFLLFAAITPAVAGELMIARPMVMTAPQFGLFLFDKENREAPPRFVPTTVIPYSIKQTFGWQMHINTHKKRITITEEFNAPSAPLTWGQDMHGTRVLSNDNKTSTVTYDVDVPADGMLKTIWAIAPADPKGPHSATIDIDGEISHTFTFTVQ